MLCVMFGSAPGRPHQCCGGKQNSDAGNAGTDQSGGRDARRSLEVDILSDRKIEPGAYFFRVGDRRIGCVRHRSSLSFVIPEGRSANCNMTGWGFSQQWRYPVTAAADMDRINAEAWCRNHIMYYAFPHLTCARTFRAF